MIAVPLVEIVVRLRLYLRRQLLKYAGQHSIDRVLLGGVAVPNGDEVCVEADREADAAELIVCCVLVSKLERRTRREGMTLKTWIDA